MKHEWKPESIEPGLKIIVCDGCARCVYSLGEDKWFSYVQHDCFVRSPTYQKLLLRDGKWRGALKAFIVNYSEEGVKPLLQRKEIDHLEVIRWSNSRKSLIVRAIFKD